LTFFFSWPILESGGNDVDVCSEVLGVVEIVDISSEMDDLDVEGGTHRRKLACMYRSLPDSASPVFWNVVEKADIPLEVLVICLRNVTNNQHRQRILHIIVQRTQIMNEYWAGNVLKHVALHVDERAALICDLCADLYEHMLRALLDPSKLFWEENFLHCLYFERRHVYRSFMTREGRWHDSRVLKSERVPRGLLQRLDQPISQAEGEPYLLDLEDEHAQKMLQAVDAGDLLKFVLLLPEHLKAVVLLLYWEERSEKDIARILNVSDRTVRNRIQAALKLLRGFFLDQMEGG
jgi:hypothetical protein